MTPKIFTTLLKTVSKVKKPTFRVGGGTRPFFRSLGKAYKERGVSGVLSEASKYKDPLHNPRKGQVLYRTHQAQTGKATLSRGLRTSIGNTAENIREVTKPGKVTKNVYDLISKQLRSARLHEVSASRVIKNKKGVEVYKSHIPFVKKKVVGKTNRGTVIVKKTPVGAATGMALSGPGWGAMSYLTSEEPNQAKRVGTALGESALWTMSPPVAFMAPTLTNILKPKKNN